MRLNSMEIEMMHDMSGYEMEQSYCRHDELNDDELVNQIETMEDTNDYGSSLQTLIAEAIASRIVDDVFIACEDKDG